MKIHVRNRIIEAREPYTSEYFALPRMNSANNTVAAHSPTVQNSAPGAVGNRVLTAACLACRCGGNIRRSQKHSA